MKNIFMLLLLCLVLIAGTNGGFPIISFADSDIEVIGTDSSEYEEDQPITQEMIDQEEEFLERKINEIDETPVNEYGSLVRKRKEKAYYTHRLELLQTSPEKYFKTKVNE